MRLAVILCSALIAACAAPADRCAGQGQSDLAALDAQVAEAEQALARGYRVIPASEGRTTLHLCTWPKAPVLFCTRHRPATKEMRAPVDRVSENASLISLHDNRAALAAEMSDRVARCRAV